MDELQGMITFFQIVIPIGGGMRILACLNYMAMDEDPTSYKRRIRNALIFIVLSECITSVLNAALSYYGGSVISY